MAGIGGYMPDSGSGTTGTGRKLNFQDWLKTVEVPAYEKMQFIPTLDDVGRPYSQKNLRIWDQLSTTAVSTTTIPSNVNLTYSSGTPSVINLTSSGIYIAVAYGANQEDAVEFDIGGGVRDNIEQAMAEGSDALATVAISSLTKYIGDATYEPVIGDLHKLATQLRIASPAVMVGVDTIHAVLHPGAMNGLMNQDQLMNAQIRGDNENPQVRGIFVQASGMLFRFTTKVPTANGVGGEGSVHVPQAYAVGWNSRPRVEQTKDGLARIYIGYANLGCVVKWDSRARAVRTITTL